MTVVLYVFLGSLRAAGIVAVMIPLSLLATFIGLTIRGIPANLLSLGAMDFGIIVDGAVIVVENVFRRLSRARRPRRSSRRRATIILDATVQVGRPTLFSMLIIIVAHIPIFTLQRQEGRIFAPMAYTVTSALIGSLIFSLTLVPLLCFFLLGEGVRRGEPAGACLPARLPAALERGAERSPRGHRRRAAALARQPGAGAAARQRVPAGAERRRDLGQRDAARRHLGQRSVAPVRAHPRRCCGSFRRCAR